MENHLHKRFKNWCNFDLTIIKISLKNFKGLNWVVFKLKATEIDSSSLR